MTDFEKFLEFFKSNGVTFSTEKIMGWNLSISDKNKKVIQVEQAYFLFESNGEFYGSVSDEWNEITTKSH